LSRVHCLLVVALLTGACRVVLQPMEPLPAITGPPNEIVARYYEALAGICATGVTSEAVALYHAVDKLWDAQPTGGGADRTSAARAIRTWHGSHASRARAGTSRRATVGRFADRSGRPVSAF
jgi:hypothetical protein